MTARGKVGVALLAIYACAATGWIALQRSQMGSVEERLAASGKTLDRQRIELEKLRRRSPEVARNAASEPRGSEASPALRVAKNATASGPAPAANTPPEAPDPKTPGDLRTRTRSAFAAFLVADEGGNIDVIQRASNELFDLLRTSTDSHVALMELLREAKGPEQINDILSFLLWNPFVGSTTSAKATESIYADALALAREGGFLEQRAAAVQVLLQYPRPQAAQGNGSAAVELWRREAGLDAKDAIFEAILEYGPYPMAESDSREVAGELRRRAQGGDAVSTQLLSCWSRDEADFQLILGSLRSSTDPGARQSLLNALQPERVITRGRERETRAALVGILSNASEGADLRELAYDMLRTSWLPWDAETETWVRKYESEKR